MKEIIIFSGKIDPWKNVFNQREFLSSDPLAEKYEMKIKIGPHSVDGEISISIFLNFSEFFKKNRNKSIDIVFTLKMIDENNNLVDGFNSELSKLLNRYELNYLVDNLGLSSPLTLSDYKKIVSINPLVRIKVKILKLVEKTLSPREYLLMEVRNSLHYDFIYPRSPQKTIESYDEKFCSKFFESLSTTRSSIEKRAMLEVRAFSILKNEKNIHYKQILEKYDDKTCISIFDEMMVDEANLILSAISNLIPENELITSIDSALRFLKEDEEVRHHLIEKRKKLILKKEKIYSLFVLEHIVFVKTLRRRKLLI